MCYLSSVPNLTYDSCLALNFPAAVAGVMPPDEAKAKAPSRQNIRNYFHFSYRVNSCSGQG